MSQYVTTPDGRRHVFPDEATPEQIKAALSGRTAPPMAMTPESNPLTAAGADLRSRAVSSLPFLGGLVGSFGGVPGMAVGGAVGEGAREALSGEQLSSGAIATEGGIQGVLGVGGGLLAKGAGAAARPIMRSALARLPKGFPDPVGTLLKERIPVSTGGLAKANALRGESAAELGRTLRRAETFGTKFSKSEVTGGVKQLLGKRALRPSVKAGIEDELTEFLAQHPDQITPTLLKEIKSEYQGGANSAFLAAMKKGGDVGSAASQRFARALQGGAKKELEKIPGVADIEARTQGLIGAGRAIETAINGPPRLVPHALSGLAGGAVGYGVSHNPIGAAAGIAASEALTSRHAISRYALILNSRGFQALMRQSPRLAAEFLHQTMNPPAQPDATDAKR